MVDFLGNPIKGYIYPVYVLYVCNKNIVAFDCLVQEQLKWHWMWKPLETKAELAERATRLLRVSHRLEI